MNIMLQITVQYVWVVSLSTDPMLLTLVQSGIHYEGLTCVWYL